MPTDCTELTIFTLIPAVLLQTGKDGMRVPVQLPDSLEPSPSHTDTEQLHLNCTMLDTVKSFMEINKACIILPFLMFVYIVFMILRKTNILSVTQESKHRKAQGRFCIYAHYLQIDGSGYSDTEIEERKCRTCGVVEDELHYLNDCVCYGLLRKRLLDNPNVRDLCTHGTIDSKFSTGKLPFLVMTKHRCAL